MIAYGFVTNGAKVIISSRSADVCKEAVDALNKIGPGSCYAIPADLSKADECKRVAAEIAKKETHLDVLVNNAGANWGETIDTYPDSAWDKVLALNVKSIFFLTRCLIPQLSAAKNGKVINIGSIDGVRIPALETYAYSTSKAAVHHLTKVLAQKLAPQNICVNAIAAGGFRTKMMAATLDKFGDVIEGAIPLKRLGSVQDIGSTCIFLGSKAGDWVTGAVLAVDGGALISANM
eukprot:TRINITY_DN1273_c0_g1_i1.p1 TRINITY_DN1273_c0_g1~~TRINITY_DN1273_c0_g1_i1.p1  ORF type:complete len:274 (+),score=83.79 TRINITY_DN1273_c0_g1_i1:123-824(+)